MTPAELLKQAEELIKDGSIEVQELRELILMMDKIEENERNAGLHKWFVPGTKYGIDKLPKHAAAIKATKDYRETLILGGNRSGKSIPLWEKIITPQGPVPIGSVKEGDYVVGSSGKPVKVTGVFPQGIRPVNCLKFSDGSEVFADSDHLWTVRDTAEGAGGKFVTKTTQELASSGKRWALPQRPVTEFEEQSLPIDPYLLGILLGDGGLNHTCVNFTTVDEFLLEQFTELVSTWNLQVNQRADGITYSAVGYMKGREGYPVNPLMEALRELNCDCLSLQKAIPKAYLVNSVHNRTELLKGLIDTDGTIDKNGKTSFYSSSRQLAEDVTFLSRSLGIKATLSPKTTYCNGDKFLSWVVYMGATDFPCVKLPRKLSRWKAPQKKWPLVIESISYVDQDECVCISVDADDKLFMVNNFILTHNTVLGCYITAVLATGLYPDNWEGVYFDEPIDAWSIGMSAQTTRDTLQKTLLGDSGNFGTGMIPRDCIGKSKMSAVAGAVDIVKVKHTSGRWSEIGFKAYKQDTPSFFGVKRHWAHLDEPAPELIYNEVVIRTAFETGEQQGRIMHTITPKEGLTRLIADLLSTSDLLAGSEGLPNLKLAMALMKAQDQDEDSKYGEY